MNAKLGKFDETYNKICKEQGIDTAKKQTPPPKEEPKDTKKPEQKQTTPPKNK